ncbi:MAG: mannose-6-phosphate isomerase [Candidatus Lokiarchaeota archaeon]|nr:mannose-6-phosphate isomerase [Candidatus Lokiarchaeota archaeon]
MPPNRTRRAYPGGLLLDRLEGKVDPRDGDRPEDWIASVVPARNPGLPPVENEGLASLRGGTGKEPPVLLKDVIEQDPRHYLGPAHVAARGKNPGFLLKLLDSATRLHVQVHPTREFARSRLNAPFGKLECYHVLATRPGTQAFIRLGFQHPPAKDEFRRVVVEQDIPAMDTWFDNIPVEPGETWLVPGGVPHAIGGGILIVEMMEPSDLSIRFEFERAGIVIPPEARFLGRDVDFAMDVLDFTPIPVKDASRRYRLESTCIRDDASCTEHVLVDSRRVDCFEARKVVIKQATLVKMDGRMLVFIVIQGAGELQVEGEKVAVKEGSKVLIPAAARVVHVKPSGCTPLVLIGCMPGAFTA